MKHERKHSGRRRNGLVVAGHFEIKQGDSQGQGAAGEFKGYAAVFGLPHPTSSWQLPPDWKDVILAGAFTRSLAEHKVAGTMPAMCLQHNLYNPIGAWLNIEQDEKGLRVEGKLAVGASDVRDVYEKMKVGAYSGLSVGFNPTRFELDQKAKVRSISDLDLFEISPVTIPAIPKATVTDVKAADGTDDDDDDDDGNDDFEKTAGELVGLCENCDGCDSREEMLTKLKGFMGTTGGDDASTDTKAAYAIREVAAIIAEETKVAKREDVNPKEGSDKYGDVTFADPKNKKYPIDTEGHIRAAWNYINKPKNAGKYSAEDVRAIKRRIISAWKKKIDKDGPPSAEDGKAARVQLMRDVEARARDAGLSRSEAKALVAAGFDTAVPEQREAAQDQRDAAGGDVVEMLRSITNKLR